MNAQSRSQLIDVLEAVKANPEIYEEIGLNERDIQRLQKEVKENKEEVSFT